MCIAIALWKMLSPSKETEPNTQVKLSAVMTYGGTSMYTSKEVACEQIQLKG